MHMLLLTNPNIIKLENNVIVLRLVGYVKTHFYYSKPVVPLPSCALGSYQARSHDSITRNVSFF